MTKVFVGNLHFQITDQALAEAFQDFKVKNGVVITRGRRSLGYGFVEFDSPDLALEAIKSKNNSLINGRPVKVEIASDNPPTRSAERIAGANWNPPITTATTGDSPINPATGGGSGPQSSSNNSQQQQQGGAPGNRSRPRKRNNANRRRKTRNNNNGPPNSSGRPAGGSAGGNNNNNPNPGSGVGDSVQQQQSNAPGGNNNTDPTNPGGPGSAGKRRNRRRTQNTNNEEPRVLSKTAVFVANLPFSVKDEDLKAFFKDNNAKTAHVVVTRNNRSRGYGFVDFDTEKDQNDAITTKNNAKFVSGNTDRLITVTPSYKTPEVTTPEN